MGNRIPKDLKMKCVLRSDDGGETWFVDRIDHLTNPYTFRMREEYLEDDGFQGMKLQRVRELVEARS